LKEKVPNASKFSKFAPKYANQQIPILVFFGTETGFSEELSWKLEEKIRNIDPTGKFYPRVVDMEVQRKEFTIYVFTIYTKDFDVIEWEKEQVVFIITSTYGDGVPPTRARQFFDYIEEKSQQQINLEKIKFSVLALGDRSYPYFCRWGNKTRQIIT
jgi:sulfite reductase alpha subunit-like flavoprotein